MKLLLFFIVHTHKHGIIYTIKHDNIIYKTKQHYEQRFGIYIYHIKENIYHMVHNSATNAVLSLLENPSMWYEPSLDCSRDFNSSIIKNSWLFKIEGLENLIQSDKVCSEMLNP